MTQRETSVKRNLTCSYFPLYFTVSRNPKTPLYARNTPGGLGFYSRKCCSRKLPFLCAVFRWVSKPSGFWHKEPRLYQRESVRGGRSGGAGIWTEVSKLFLTEVKKLLVKLPSLWALSFTALCFAKSRILQIDTLGASEQSSWFCDACSGHMAHGWMGFPNGASKTSLSLLHCRPLFPALHWIFPLGLFCKQCVPTELTIFSPSLSTFLTNDFTSGVSDDQTNPWKAWSSVSAHFISSSSCHLWIYTFISTAVIVCRLTIFLLIHWDCSS